MTGFSRATREAILSRSLGFCEVCGVDRVEHLHHRRPRAMGSSKRGDTNTAANALGVSMACHQFVESHREMAFDKGWLVRQRFAPADVPVQVHGGIWVLLTETGDVTRPPTGRGLCERCGQKNDHAAGCQLSGPPVTVDNPWWEE